ncbi:MAG: EAL domain-containing protein [Roseburia sp.]|nr:EAL domain-containing protein [Roseburia sp.]
MGNNANEMTMISPLTGLFYGQTFFEKAEECLQNTSSDTCNMIAIDIEHFRLYNKIHGREEGDVLLKMIAELLRQFEEKNGGVVGYLGGDNFGIFAVCELLELRALRLQIEDAVKMKSGTIGYMPAFGVYAVADRTLPAATMYDHATVALAHVLGDYTNRLCYYDSDMDDKVEEELRILSDVQEGIDNDEFTFYIQPQCDITKGRIVGGESLVRWIHREKGLVPPGIFIPVLEKNGFVADLDRIVWEKVCKWQRECLDKGYDPVPISINVSRIDIFSMDVPKYLFGLLDKYDLPLELLKVEITESAYAESSEKIEEMVNVLRERGIVVMMDDFGSGYSSLNMLKSVPVDVLKMDMRFLEINEQEEEKGIGILDSVINMAKQMRVPIVVEGVETQKQENHLLKMGCRYAQGYLYYKPMSTDAFEDLISDPRNVDHDGFWCRQTESVHIKEFLDTNLFNDVMANNILGPAAFYDLYENNIEITRVNEQYFRLAGISTQEDEGYRKRFWNHVRDDDRQVLVSIFERAYNEPTNGSSGFIHYLQADETVLWVYMRVFFLREKEGHKLFYASLTDMTSMESKAYELPSFEVEIEELTDKQRAHVEKYYGNLPGGYGIGKVLLDENGKPIDYEISYANKELGRLSGGSVERLRYMMSRIFAEKQEEFLDKAYQAAYLGKRVEMHVYSNITSRYLDITMYQYQYGYASCMLQDVTHTHIYEKALGNVMLSFREVYFLHLQDNYCRMIYPDDNHMLERGNYEEVVGRHFSTGKILPRDEEGIRKFLSLDNLRRALEEQDTVEYKYKRSIKPAGEEWCQTSVTVSERHSDGTPKTATITIRSIEALMREKEDRKRQNMAEMLANMSDGFFIYRATDDERILYANPPVLKLFGCDTMDEFRELVDDSFQGIVHPEDLNRVQWEIHEQVKHSETNMDFIRYRIIRKDGEVRWIDDCGHLEDSGSSEDAKLFYVFVADITDSMTEVQKNKLITQSKHFNV